MCMLKCPICGKNICDCFFGASEYITHLKNCGDQWEQGKRYAFNGFLQYCQYRKSTDAVLLNNRGVVAGSSGISACLYYYIKDNWRKYNKKQREDNFKNNPDIAVRCTYENCPLIAEGYMNPATGLKYKDDNWWYEPVINFINKSECPIRNSCKKYDSNKGGLRCDTLWCSMIVPSPIGTLAYDPIDGKLEKWGSHPIINDKLVDVTYPHDIDSSWDMIVNGKRLDGLYFRSSGIPEYKDGYLDFYWVCIKMSLIKEWLSNSQESFILEFIYNPRIEYIGENQYKECDYSNPTCDVEKHYKKEIEELKKSKYECWLDIEAKDMRFEQGYSTKKLDEINTQYCTIKRFKLKAVKIQEK